MAPDSERGSRLEAPQAADKFQGAPPVVANEAKIHGHHVLDTLQRLGLEWRGFIDTQRSTELGRPQRAGAPKDRVLALVPTSSELDDMVLELLEHRYRGRSVNVLYTGPLQAREAAQVSKALKALGPGSLTVPVGHPAQVPALTQIRNLSSCRPFVLLDVDKARPGSGQCRSLAKVLLALHDAGDISLHGVCSRPDVREDQSGIGVDGDAEGVDGPMERVVDVLAEAALNIRAERYGMPLTLFVDLYTPGTSRRNPDGGRAQELDSVRNLESLARRFHGLQEQRLSMEVHVDLHRSYE